MNEWIFTQDGQLINAAHIIQIGVKGCEIRADVTGFANPNYQATLFTAESPERAQAVLRSAFIELKHRHTADFTKVEAE